MAKRRRLGPAAITGQGADAALTTTSETVLMPPIAQVAGAAASEAALQELAGELTRARAEGRLVQDIALDQIDEAHLTRDRIAADRGELQALAGSIAARGQQMPIEVVDLGPDASPRYGLVSGWRRLTAIRSLAQAAPDDFPTVRAILRRPDTAAEAYLSMVEENELRVGLSYYERAQIAARAADLGVFESSTEAVQNLFSAASKAKRSKINAFIRVFRVLDPVLKFPDVISERLGLRIAKALDAGKGVMLYKGLQNAGPFDGAEAELARINLLLTRGSGSELQDRVLKRQFPGNVAVTETKTGLTVSGVGVDATLTRDLTQWLEARQSRLT